MAADFTIKLAMPPPEAFKALRDSAGWGDISITQAQQSLKNTRLGITAYNGETPIGMARLIGDGVLNVYIQDVVVAPQYQGQGVGKAVISTLISRMQNTLPEDCTVGLLAASGQEGFYSSFSFITRPDKDYGAGMFAKLQNLTDGTSS
ncbi:MAG: GNAT family N-acetyltransferase [Hellea sp.]